MERKPRLLDLFCGAGGCSVGYERAGFGVSGVDIEDHPSYPRRFNFYQGEAVAYLRLLVAMVKVGPSVADPVVIHASPPCQSFTRAGHLREAQGKTTAAVDLVAPTRELLQEWAALTGGVYVIENVPGAPLLDPVQVCGSSFGLGVRRHRLFESNVPLQGSVCDHRTQGRPVGVYGSMRDNIPDGGRTAHSIEEARAAMGIDWMRWRSDNQEWNDLKEAIPPAYTEYIGTQLLASVSAHPQTPPIKEQP